MSITFNFNKIVYLILSISPLSESGGVEEDEDEAGPITNIDDFEEGPSTNTILADSSSRGTRTPLAITHSYSLDEREHPHSPSSNDERPIVSGSTGSGRSIKYRPSSGERMKSKSRHHQLSNIAITSASLTPGKIMMIIRECHKNLG